MGFTIYLIYLFKKKKREENFQLADIIRVDSEKLQTKNCRPFIGFMISGIVYVVKRKHYIVKCVNICACVCLCLCRYMLAQ